MKLHRVFAPVVVGIGAVVLASTLVIDPAAAVIDVEPTAGGDMFLADGQSQFRYGPTIVLDSAGMHVLTCSNGTGSAWDFVRMQSSTDGGNTWGTEQVVLAPTAGSRDAFSTCDPGVAEFGGYYYLAYTSTENPTGAECDIYVARSTSLAGPYEKWNGSGWGGMPQPIIEFDGPEHDYGAGEPSLVVVDETLYLYYTWISHDETGMLINQTRLMTAPTTNPSWPASLNYEGIAFDKRTEIDADSIDVKYVDAWESFIAVNSAKRFGPHSFIQAWESVDGLTWTPSNLDSQPLKPYLHNVGISGDSQGHLDIEQQNYLGYAYGSAWEQANWSTAIDPIELSASSKPAQPRIYTATPGDGSAVIDFQLDAKAASYTLRYGTSVSALVDKISGITDTPVSVSGLTNGTKYYFALEGVSPEGSSGLGAPVSATPLAYQEVSVADVTSSSTYSSALDPSRVIDDDPSTFFSSAFHPNAFATEWLTLDTGAVTNLGRVVIENREPGGLAGFAIDPYLRHTVQTSLDGTTWASHDLRLDVSRVRGADGTVRATIDFPVPVATRYVRLNATRLNPDDLGGYYLQVAEVRLFAIPGGELSSSHYPTLPASHLADASDSTFFSSVTYADPYHTEWAGLDLGTPRPLSGMLLIPRSGGQGFPRDFTIEISDDGVNWMALSGQSYTSFSNPGSVAQGFRFSTIVNARYVRVRATLLGADSIGNFALQLAGLVPDVLTLPATVTVSSTVLPSLGAENLLDGSSSTFWSSSGHSSPSASEWVRLDLGSTQPISEVRLSPREDYAFPKAFALEYSLDGTTWSPLPGKQFASYPSPASAGTYPDPQQVMALQHPIEARYLRLTATDLRADEFGNYYLQLSDISVR